MSLHILDPKANAELIQRLCRIHLREPSGLRLGNGLGQPPTEIEFTPDLTVPEEATLQKIFDTARAGVLIGPDDLSAMKTDRALLKAFVAIPSPTTAQTANAAKALIRILDIIFSPEDVKTRSAHKPN